MNSFFAQSAHCRTCSVCQLITVAGKAMSNASFANDADRTKLEGTVSLCSFDGGAGTTSLTPAAGAGVGFGGDELSTWVAIHQTLEIAQKWSQKDS